MFTATGMQDIPTPRALTTEEVRQTVTDFRLAARCAIEAGADGVEIHGANAYLVLQFFAPSANTRTDEYGGSTANRARFAVEVAGAIAEEIGADRTAIRLSPGITMWGIDEGAEGPALYRYLVAELGKLGLAYLHILHAGDELLLGDIRALWKRSELASRITLEREFKFPNRLDGGEDKAVSNRV
jgi:2,4-dienoyl-CoA reductase-like NADH-dependent reductase (Old Yellow Enzyme family)